ncbi:flagellar biosynthesis protein FlhB [bacterium]|nr:flagellar biosynthesis protein FlhB [bacterium]MBU1071992.1 flagellar biosynthesis protein FlhB [bacterium]MBU1674545.1 flagellar biosynthesis protein FlhB [bacterium]
MADAPGGERTERATPRRREKALEKGQVALSQEVNSALVLLVGFSLLFAGGRHMQQVLGENARYLFGQPHAFLLENPFALVEMATANLGVILAALAPLMLGILVIAFMANVLQVGWKVNVSAMAFRWDNINPVNGIKNVFSKRAAFDLAKNVLKIALIGLLSWYTVATLGTEMPGAAELPVEGILALGLKTMARLAYRLVAFLAVLALLDWVFQKWQHEQKLMMTKQELREEQKDIEGDPQVKARMRSIQLEVMRKRMLAEVPRADVVVTNPTHFAVALRYSAGDMAPRVVAKGQDSLAETIKRIARENRVPVLENKPLARALHKIVEVGAFIPDEFYQAVAEVLAYVYRLKRS